MRLKIEIQPEADEDLRQLVEFLGQKSPVAVERVLEAIDHSLSLIAAFPRSAPMVPRNPNWRIRVVPSHSFLGIVYEFNESKLSVMAFWDSRQNPDKLHKRLN